MIYGVDVSNHQEQFDFIGWDFAFIKSSEGTGFKDGRFTQHVANARAAGCLVAAYHYVRGGDVQGQFDNIRSMVPTDIPVILDVEDGAGSVDSIKQLAAKLRAAGYAVPLTYFPRWYWNSIGQPDLSGLAPLWLSWYPDYKPRPREQAYAMVPGSGKQPFGGIDSAPVIQFTSTPFDQNAFDGTRDQLAALLGSRQEEDDLSADDVLYAKKIIGPDGKETGLNLNDFTYWTNFFANMIPAIASKLDAMGAVVAEIATKDDRIELTDAQAEKLGSQIGAMLDVGFDELAEKLEGLSKEDMRAVLREFRWVPQSSSSTNPGGGL